MFSFLISLLIADLGLIGAETAGGRDQFFEKTVAHRKQGFKPSNQLFYITAYFF